MIFSYIVLYLKCLYVDIWSNKSIYLSNKIKHLKWFTKYRVDTICDGRTDGQRQRVNIRRIQESCNILRMKMRENVLFPLLWRFFLLKNTPYFEYGGFTQRAAGSHGKRERWRKKSWMFVRMPLKQNSKTYDGMKAVESLRLDFWQNS